MMLSRELALRVVSCALAADALTQKSFNARDVIRETEGWMIGTMRCIVQSCTSMTGPPKPCPLQPYQD